MASEAEDNPRREGELAALFDKALALHQQGELAQANTLYRQIISSAPKHADALHMLGLMAVQVGQPQPAIELISRAIAVAATPVMHVNRAVALARLDRLEEAAADYAAAAAMQPDLVQAHLRRAGLLRRLGRPDEALAAYDCALTLDPGLSAAHLERGSLLDAQLRRQEALAAFDAALACDSANAAAHYNRAVVLRKLGRTDEAIAASRAAAALQPDFAMAHVHLATCLLQQGELEAGFDEYEWRKRTPDFVDPRYDLPSVWNGEDVSGRTLFIYPERFLGDMIQFCRYALLAEQGGAHVILAAQAPLHALLRTLTPSVELIAATETPPRFDYQCALISLPRAFGATVPAFDSYLAAQPARVEHWRRRIGAHGLKIGVCWQGSALPYAAPLQRSFPLKALAPLAAHPGARLISLQKQDGLEQLADLPSGMTVETFEGVDDGPDAFLDTAAIIAACDLVVTADTAIAHLAGALGAPVWLALPELAEWRWQEGRGDSPWYPSMRLFRQPRAGDWDSVFIAMAEALARL